MSGLRRPFVHARTRILLSRCGIYADEISNFDDAEGFKSMYGFSARIYGKALKFGRVIACNKTGAG